MSFKKVDLGGYDSTSRSPQLVDQSSPEFFSPNAGKITVDQILDRF